MIIRSKLLSTLLVIILCINFVHAQNGVFIALDNTGKLYSVNTGTCTSTPLTICSNFGGNTPLSIAMDGTTLYIVDNKGFLYSNTLGPTGTTATCVNLGQFKSKSTAMYGMTVGPGPVVYAASGSLIETYTPTTPTTGTFASLGSLPATWTIGGDLLFYKGQLYEAVNINGSTTNNALIQVNLSNPASSTLYMNFNAGTKVFGFASVKVPCDNNQAYALSTNTSTTDIFAVNMINKTQAATATCTLNYKVNDAASVAETQSATPPVAPTVVSPINYCQNDPVSPLSATVASSMDTLKWYTVSTGGTSTGSPVPAVSSATLGTVKYYVSDFDTSTKCESTRDSIIVTVNAYPAVPTINPLGPDTICTGSTLLLTSTALAGNINQWYLNNSSIAGATGTTYTAGSAGNYTIKTSTPAGCSKTAIPSVLALTQATIAYPGSPFCPVGTKAVTQTGDTGGRYTVNPVGLIIDSITGTINLGTSKSGTYTVTYTVGPAHCPFTTTVTVQAQSAGISYSKPTYCKAEANQPVIFAPGSLTTGTFSSSPAGLSISANGTINPSASNVGNYLVSYTYGTAGIGCGIMTAIDSVSITTGPTVPSIQGLNNLCNGTTITMSNTLSGGVWSSSNTNVATVDANTGIVTAVNQGNVTILYTVNGGVCGNPPPQTKPVTVNAASASSTPVSICPSALPYTWNGNNYPTAGIYTIHLTNYAGCDSAATLVLTLKATSASSTPVSICPSALPYTWNGNTYTTAGTYTVHLTNSAGCDSAATLVLSLKAISASSTPVSICPSALPYSWNSNNYSSAGTYTVHLTNSAGCDSAATLVLSLKATSTSSTPVSICPNALPYSWNSNNYSSAGTYTVHLTNSAGCDSAATLVLTLNATSASSTSVSICPTALPYIWNNNTYQSAGSYTVHLTNSAGCDSAASLVLTLKATSTSSTPVSICPTALPYIWNGNTYQTAGTYTVHLTNSVGCDSAATLVLTLKATSTSSTPVSICPSVLPYLWNNNTYQTAGTYTVHMTNNVGCDSAATLVLTLKATSTSSTPVSICPNALPYIWNGNTYQTAGTYTVHLTNSAGCDSAATLVLSLTATSVSSFPVSICPSALPYSWNGNTYQSAGNYTIHFTNNAGCDSAVTLVLSLLSPSVSSTPVRVCQTALPYSWNGNIYPTAGTYTVHLANSVGCDSAATLVLSLIANSVSSASVSICTTALPYLWNGNSYPTAGTYTVHLTNYAGCDSAATLILSIKSPSVSTTPVSICPTALPYTWNGNTYQSAGIYLVHLTNSIGCDSAATLVLSLKVTSVSTTPVSICPTALPYLWNGNTYQSAGSYTVHLTNSVGCDSAATLVLTLKTISVSTTPVSICPASLPYSWNGNTYQTAGSYTIHLTNSVGCDSAATLVLTVNSPTTSLTNTTICLKSLPYTWNSNIYSSAGTYTVHLTNYSGCDSAAVLNLTVISPPVPYPVIGKKTLCTNATTQLSNANSGGNWNSVNNSIATVNIMGVVSAVSAGTDTITYQVANMCGTVIDSFPIKIFPLSSSSFITDPLVPDVCIGEPVTFSDNTTGSTVVSSVWYLGNNIVDTGLSVSYTYPDATTYWVTHKIVDQNGCVSNPSTILVTVQALPVVSLVHTQYVLQNDSITFYPIVTGLDYNSTTVWTPVDFLTNPNTLNPVCTPMHDTTYTLTVTNAIGCKGSDTTHVIVLDPVIIPNVFTPNGDGIHDSWLIPDLDKYPTVNLKVFDRNGAVIYTCNSHFTGWNGKYNGKDVPFGTYWYILDRGFHLPILSGSVTIIR